MPLPTPNDNEKEDEFIHRCMSSDAAQEFSDQKQRVAVCYSQWREKHKDAKAMKPRFDIEGTVTFSDLEGG